MHHYAIRVYMIKYLRPSLLVFLLCFTVLSAEATPYFESCAFKTGRTAGMVIPESAAPTINGEALSKGSEIAIFTPNGSCAGRGMWAEKSLAIAIWGNDVLTEEKDGLDAGDDLVFQIWDAQSKKLYVGPELVRVRLDSSASYYSDKTVFKEGAIYRITQLSIDTRLSPDLMAPRNGGSFRDNVIDLSWRAVSGAATYNLQVATNSSFANPLIDVAFGDTEASVEVEDEATYYWRVGAQTANGVSWSETFTFKVDPMSPPIEIPGDVALEQNYPNPFNPSTTIPFTLKHDSDVILEVYNMLGQRVAVLVDSYLPSGRHEYPWNAGDLPSGMYVYRITAGRTTQTNTLTLVK